MAVEIDAVAQPERTGVEAHATDQLHDHVAPQAILGAQQQAALHRQFALVQAGIILIDGLDVLAVQIAGAADRGHADAEQLRRELGGIALEIALQRAVVQRVREFVGPIQSFCSDYLAEWEWRRKLWNWMRGAPVQAPNLMDFLV